MIRRPYDRTLSLAAHPRALWALAIIAFVESSFFPIPPDILMIPMILTSPTRAWVIASVATIASVAGGLLGYLIGAVLYDVVGQPIFDFYGIAEVAESFNQRFKAEGAKAVFFAGVTPFPYKIITIISGWSGLSLPIFIVISIVARGLRFFVVAGLLWKFGPPIRTFIEKYLGILFTLFVVVLLGGFYVLRFL